MLTLNEVFEANTGKTYSMMNHPVSEVVIDSRQVKPGALFVALPGESVDGHEFVGQALERGAIAALVDKQVEVETSRIDLRKPPAPEAIAELEPPYILRVEHALRALQQTARLWRQRFDVRVIGITGSVGKSTTKELAADVLSQRYRTVRSPGNLNNEIGLPLSLLKMGAGDERAVLEMGFYVPGEIAELCEIAKPQVGVVTNISQVHLERAGSLEAIVQGKGELVESLPPAPEGVAILNYDEPLVRSLAERTQARLFYYGLSPEADLWASDVESLGLEGVRFVLHYGEEQLHVRVPMLGRHSVHTSLRAAAVGLTEGLSWQEIVSGLQSSHAQLRLVAVHGPHGSLILDDTYNAAPASVIAALNLLAELEGRRVAVLGDMLELGSFEERGHRMVGARAAQVADLLLAVGRRARWIGDEAKLAGMEPDEVVFLEDSDGAIAYLKDHIQEGDVILVKGSHGMRMDRVVEALEERA